MEFSITRGLLSSCAGVEKEHKASSFNTRFRDGEFHGVSSPFRTYTYGVRESTGSMRAFQASHGPTGMRHTALKNGFQQSHITRNHAPHGLKGRFPAKPCHTVARNYVPHGQMEVFQQSHVRGQPCATRPNGGFPAKHVRATMRHTALKDGLQPTHVTRRHLALAQRASTSTDRFSRNAPQSIDCGIRRQGSAKPGSLFPNL